MGIMLRKSFKGNHLWIPPIADQIEESLKLGWTEQQIQESLIKYDKKAHDSNPKVKIDAMFFTATEEPVVLQGKDRFVKKLLDEMSDTLHVRRDTKVPEYLSLNTVIICNPNALSYQSMVNYPHAYYLKYFLNKQINCLVWNYRGYGRTKGSMLPHLLASDIE